MAQIQCDVLTDLVVEGINQITRIVTTPMVTALAGRDRWPVATLGALKITGATDIIIAHGIQ